MKNTALLLFITISCIITNAQSYTSIMIPNNSFDYSTIDQKTLYIPAYDLDDKFVKRMMKKGNNSELQDAINDVGSYNEAWEDAMNTSSFDACPYEIRGYDRKKLEKEKNDKAIIMVFWVDNKTDNEMVSLLVTGPKKQTIAQTYINDLDLTNASDIRLMINLLNYSLLEAAEASEEKGRSSSARLNKGYKADLVEIYEKLPEMTFYIPDQEFRNAAKTAEKKRELKMAFDQYWNLSRYEFISQDELEEKRRNAEPNSYYWKMITIKTTNAAIVYRLNYMLTTERDEPFFMFLGSKKFKPRTMEEIQKKIHARAARYAK